MMRFDETDSSVSVFRQPSMNSNGNTRDKQGRLITCEHLGRRVTRTEHNGSITILVDRFEGKKLNSPNDAVVANDDAIWFTDPSYGIDSDYEGATATSDIGKCNVYRLDHLTGNLDSIATDFLQPNGLAFSADGRVLYVSDTGATHFENGPRHIRSFQVDGLTLKGGDVFSESTAGMYDGFRLDNQGNIWTSAGDGVHCLNQNGDLIGKLLIPETVANVCFGGLQNNRLFICGTTSLYATYLNISGS
jgi:gluconolactonase